MIRIYPIQDTRVRALCTKPYEGHSRGCPNFNDPKHSHRCPPGAPLFWSYFDPTEPVYAVVNEFDLAAHVERMRTRNPSWSDRQLRCVLYWQQTARKQLQAKIDSILPTLPGYEATWCPEGMGIDVTTTLALSGVILEWPPKQVARQVAFIGKRSSQP